MFKLHGSPMSNYYNVVKLVLLEKGLDFAEVFAPPAQTEDFLAISPMGKIPVLQVREGYLTETLVIIEFLEDIYPELPLYPTNHFSKAEIKRICHMCAVYIDLPMRPMMAAVMTGAPVPEDIKGEARQALEKGLAGLARVAKPAPWLGGKMFTAADIVAYYCLGLSEGLARAHLGLDIAELFPGYRDWKGAIAGRDIVAQVDAAQQAAVEAFFKHQKQRG